MRKCRWANDALHYISTCLSVGYARIFPVTQVGKLVATIVMAIGPSLSGWVIRGTHPAPVHRTRGLPEHGGGAGTDAGAGAPGRDSGGA